jgi:hypothetical protein
MSQTTHILLTPICENARFRKLAICLATSGFMSHRDDMCTYVEQGVLVELESGPVGEGESDEDKESDKSHGEQKEQGNEAS